MRNRLTLVLLAALPLGGCGYFPTRPDPIRYVTSPAEVSSCHRLGSVGLSRTDGLHRTVPDLAAFVADPLGASSGAGYQATGEIAGSDFGARLNVMRDAALGLGASDLLLTRRIYRDWSYVQGTAFLCRR